MIAKCKQSDDAVNCIDIAHTTHAHNERERETHTRTHTLRDTSTSSNLQSIRPFIILLNAQVKRHVVLNDTK